MDNLGFHVISCEVLRASINDNQVYEPEEKCFNGRKMTELQMDHMMQLQKLWIFYGQQFLSLFESNVNHNPSYTNIKHIDGALADFLSEVPVMLDQKIYKLQTNQKFTSSRKNIYYNIILSGQRHSLGTFNFLFTSKTLYLIKQKN